MVAIVREFVEVSEVGIHRLSTVVFVVLPSFSFLISQNPL